MQTDTTSTATHLHLGDRITIPGEAVAFCLQHLLEDAEVVGFRGSAINGPIVELKTREPWQAAPGWPVNETIGIPAKELQHVKPAAR